MATILLSAAGAAIGSGFGGTVLGLSGAVIGRAVGATLGRAIDQRLLGVGSEAVETGRIDRFRLSGASEGAPIPQIYGRVRTGGQIIWATQFQESSTTQGGGKGAPRPRVTSYSYTVSFAVALCEGKILTVGRVWADGVELDPSTMTMRVYTGSEEQLPDAKIEAVEGAGLAPAYRGIAYVVIEDLDLSRFGNRVPQMSFEVVRPAQGDHARTTTDIARAVRAVAMVPGTGEYALATSPLHFDDGLGAYRSANIHTPSGRSDFETSLRQLRGELPNVGSVSLIVSWFGNDLRCGNCQVEPKVEQTRQDASKMAWRAGGIGRSQATEIAKENGRSIYGGTPSDGSVVEAIRAIRAGGQDVMFYPFILMDQNLGNTLPNPYSGGTGQPSLPWRGRITLSVAPGNPASPDQTASAAAEVDAFFGMAQATDFTISGDTISYTGPDEWRYRRFILHYAHLCALAGGVDAFCIGSEMRGLTQIRGAAGNFPAVAAMRQLAADVRAILGPETRITYAADWSEYFGYHVDGSVYFHLDPLWADENIDFIGIDNYMPAADWRDGDDHVDAHWKSIYNLDYLVAGITRGEGFDWYYDSPEGAAAQRRSPIADGAHGEDWVYRFKDIRGWWANPHYNRVNGVRDLTPTDWVPQSKPIWFTEYGCAAIDKGANQPNKFLDAKSSESSLPKFSNARRDDTMQMQYLRAMHLALQDEAFNPVSDLYGAPMLDLAHAHAWAWDARPFPQFPNDDALWSDGVNYSRGHWVSGRSGNQPLSLVVAEICERSGVFDFDVTELFGAVRGYSSEGVGTARSALQPLMLAYGFEAIEREGVLKFKMRGYEKPIPVSEDMLVWRKDRDASLETVRAVETELAGRVRIGYIEAEGDFSARQVEAIFPDEESFGVSQNELALALTGSECRDIAERWLSEARVARESSVFALPRSFAPLGAGDALRLRETIYRIDRVEQSDVLLVEAVRMEPSIYQPAATVDERPPSGQFVPSSPVFPLFLDLPLLDGSEIPHSPHIAVSARPWPQSVAVWSSSEDAGYTLNRLIEAPSMIGVTQTPLAAARSGLWDRGAPLQVRLVNGALSGADQLSVLNGINAMAIGDGSADNWEIIQFVEALMIGPSTYEISTRLRGQLGSDGIRTGVWPAGSMVVFLDKALIQIDVLQSMRGLPQHYRIGAASNGLDHPDVIHRVEAFSGNGLRPYSPVHLRAATKENGDIHIRWIRRTRIDGDTWEGFEVPLGEEREAYILRLVAAGETVREVELSQPEWVYPASLQVTDNLVSPIAVQVAMVSDRFGPGPYAMLELQP